VRGAPRDAGPGPLSGLLGRLSVSASPPRTSGLGIGRCPLGGALLDHHLPFAAHCGFTGHRADRRAEGTAADARPVLVRLSRLDLPRGCGWMGGWGVAGRGSLAAVRARVVVGWVVVGWEGVGSWRP
jgi:hypothetical protein